MAGSREGERLLADQEADVDHLQQSSGPDQERPLAEPAEQVDAKEKGGPTCYWFESPITIDYLRTTLEKQEWEGWIMAVFVDSLYLHKSTFEAKDRALRKSLLDKLNTLAWGLFKDLAPERSSQSLSPSNGHPQRPAFESDVHLGEWCMLLLCPYKRRGNGEHGAADKRRDKDYPFDEKNSKRIDSFKRLQTVWKDPDFMKMFPTLLEKLDGRRRLKLLLAMCVEVPDDILHGQQFQHYDWTRPVRLARGRWNGGKFDEQGSDRPPDDLVAVVPKLDGWARRLFSRGYRSKVALYYTEIPGALVGADIVFPNKCSISTVKLDIVKYNMAIMCSNNHWNQFKTPFAQALAKAQWDLAWPLFSFKLLLDCLFQCLVSWNLSPVSRSSPRLDKEEVIKKWADNNQITLWTIVILGCFGLFLTCIEFLSLLCLVEWRQSATMVFKATNVYRLVNFLIELWACFLVILVARDYIWQATTVAEDSVLVNHPFRISALVFSKWCQLVLQFMNLSFFLDTLLPAWRAMVSNESMSFLLALLVMSFGTALAYFALPVYADPSNQTAVNDTDVHFFDQVPVESILSALARTAKLNFMTEVDYDEFLGEEDGYKTDVTEHFHWALVCFSVVCGILFPVIALNLYVGVLTVAYESARKALIHSEGVLHATTSSRYLLPLKYLPLKYLPRCCGTIWCGTKQDMVEQPTAGTWIAMTDARARESHSGFEVDPLDVNDSLTIMQAHAEDLEELEEVEEKLEKEVKKLGSLAESMRRSFTLGQDLTQDVPQTEQPDTLTNKVDRLARDVESIKISIKDSKADNSKTDETDVNSIKRSIEELRALIDGVN